MSQQPGDSELLIQTEHWNAVLDKNQEYLGKSFVTLRKHKETLSELSSNEWSDLHTVMQKMEEAIEKAFAADVCNWSCLMNNAVAAHQPTHVHWHLHPRYLKGATFLGLLFPDPKWPRRREKVDNIVSEAIFNQIATKIRENI